SLTALHVGDGKVGAGVAVIVEADGLAIQIHGLGPFALLQLCARQCAKGQRNHLLIGLNHTFWRARELRATRGCNSSLEVVGRRHSLHSRGFGRLLRPAYRASLDGRLPLRHQGGMDQQNREDHQGRPYTRGAEARKYPGPQRRRWIHSLKSRKNYWK